MNIKSITFQRASSSISYKYNFEEIKNGYTIWKREDLDLWCLYNVDKDWCIVDKSKNILGWPKVKNGKNREYPPKGLWISEKEDKSFEYTFNY